MSRYKDYIVMTFSGYDKRLQPHQIDYEDYYGYRGRHETLEEGWHWEKGKWVFGEFLAKVNDLKNGKKYAIKKVRG